MREAKEEILIIFAAVCTWRKYLDSSRLGRRQSADWRWGEVEGGITLADYTVAQAMKVFNGEEDFTLEMI